MILTLSCLYLEILGVCEITNGSTPNVPLSNCNDKVWVDNLDTCKYLKKSICKDVTKYRTVQKPYQKCDQVPYDECKDVPFDSCELVTKETCQNNAYENCIQVPYQDCIELINF